MLGYEQIMPKMNDGDMELVSIFVAVFSKGNRYVGRENAISNKTIREKLEVSRNMTIADRRVRKVISYIRLKQLVPRLCASNKGYFVAKNVDEFKEYLESYEERVKYMYLELAMMKRELNRDLTMDQLMLFDTPVKNVLKDIARRLEFARGVRPSIDDIVDEFTRENF